MQKYIISFRVPDENLPRAEALAKRTALTETKHKEIVGKIAEWGFTAHYILSVTLSPLCAFIVWTDEEVVQKLKANFPDISVKQDEIVELVRPV